MIGPPQPPSQAVAAAQREIAAILAELERTTGQLVDAIALSIIDSTSINSPAQTLLMSVRIDMQRARVAHQWDVDA